MGLPPGALLAEELQFMMTYHTPLTMRPAIQQQLGGDCHLEHQGVQSQKK